MVEKHGSLDGGDFWLPESPAHHPRLGSSSTSWGPSSLLISLPQPPRSAPGVGVLSLCTSVKSLERILEGWTPIWGPKGFQWPSRDWKPGHGQAFWVISQGAFLGKAVWKAKSYSSWDWDDLGDQKSLTFRDMDCGGKSRLCDGDQG